MKSAFLFVLLAVLAALVLSHNDHTSMRERRSFCGRALENIACILFPDVTEGPYYFDDLWVRQDITEGTEGVPLRLVLTVQNTRTCEVAANAAVDLWHCDAIGQYSHFLGPSNGDPGSGTDDSTFLRGIQLTDKSGAATFDTVFPGWYQGRTIHMHIKVHIGGNVTWHSEDETYRYEGGETTFTGQLFFNETISATIAMEEPYVSHDITRLTNSQDSIYLQGGYYGLTELEYVDASAGLAGGLIGYLTIGVEF